MIMELIACIAALNAETNDRIVFLMFSTLLTKVDASDGK